MGAIALLSASPYKSFRSYLKKENSKSNARRGARPPAKLRILYAVISIICHTLLSNYLRDFNLMQQDIAVK